MRTTNLYSPYKLKAPWHAFEFAFHVLEAASNLVIVTMSWVTREDRRHFSRMPNEPDMDTLTYWITRLEPLIRSNNDEEMIVVFCNRTGTEDQVTYAGTSAVIGIHDGEVKVYGLLGRGDKDLLVVDTDNRPYAKLLNRPSDQDRRDGAFAASSLKLTPLAVRPPRLIIPQSPHISSSAQGEVTSATSYRSSKSLHSVQSNDSGASVETIRAANPRAPEESTPYPDSSLSLSGHPLSSLRSDYGGYFTAAPRDSDDMTPITPFEDVSPVTPLRSWRPFDDDDAGPSGPFPWAEIKGTIPESSEDEGESDDNDLGVSTESCKDAQSPRSNTSKSSAKAPQESQSEMPISRPSSPKTRNASRSGAGRRDSSLGRHDGTPDVSQHVERISQRAESSRRNDGSSKQQHETVTSSPMDPATARLLIPIAASPSILESGTRAKDSKPVAIDYGRPASQRRPSHSRPRDALDDAKRQSISISDAPSPDAQDKDKSARSISRGRQPRRRGSNSTNPKQLVAPERSSSDDSTKNAVLHERVAKRHSSQTKHSRSASRSHDHDEPSHVHIRSVPDESGVMRVAVVSCAGCPDHGRRSASTHSHDDPASRRRRRASKAASEGARSDLGARWRKDKAEGLYNQAGTSSRLGSSKPALLSISTKEPLRVRSTYDPSTPRAMIYIPRDE